MKYVRLKDVAEINAKVLSDSMPDDFSFRYIDIRSVSQGSVSIPADDVTFGSAPSRARRLAEPGDTVVSTVRTYLRAVAPVPETDEPLVFSTGFAVLHPTCEVDGRYLSYYCQSAPFVDEVVARSVGVSYPAINPREIGNFRLDLPTLEDQRRIADFLDAETRRIDALVTLGERQAALIAEKRASLIFATVTEGLNGTAQMTTVDDAWFRFMPEHWSLVAFRHLALRSNAGEVVDKSWWGDGDELLFSCSRDPVASDFQDFPPEKRTGENDILLTRNATPYVHLPQRGSIYSNVVQRVTLPTHCNRRWARYSLETASSSIHGYGVSIDTLNYGTWKALPLPVPPSGEQGEIARFLDDQVSSVAADIASLRRRGELLQERRQALTTAAVTGQLDVATARGAA